MTRPYFPGPGAQHSSERRPSREVLSQASQEQCISMSVPGTVRSSPRAACLVGRPRSRMSPSEEPSQETGAGLQRRRIAVAVSPCIISSSGHCLVEFSNVSENQSPWSPDPTTMKMEWLGGSVADQLSPAPQCGRCRKRKIRCSGDPGDGTGCNNCKTSGTDPSQCQFLRVSATCFPCRMMTAQGC